MSHDEWERGLGRINLSNGSLREMSMADQVADNENNSQPQDVGDKPRSVKVWDPLVRIGHWVLAGGFLTAYLTAEENTDIHVVAGYVVAAIVATRLVWGFIGPKHARFANFVRGPGAVLGYLGGLFTGKAKRTVGHNPAGAAMIVALLIGVGGTAISGMALYAVEEGKGPLAGFISAGPGAASEGADVEAFEDEEHERGEAVGANRGGERHEDEAEEMYEDVHKAFVNFTLLLIALHIFGVLASSLAHRENLVGAMITGRKRPE